MSEGDVAVIAIMSIWAAWTAFWFVKCLVGLRDIERSLKRSPKKDPGELT